MLIALIISFLFNGVLFYVAYNLLTKIEKNEETITDQHTKTEYAKSYVETMSKVIENIDKKLIEIDAKGTFKSDDEVGWFFKELLYIKDLLNKFKIDNNAEETKTKDN